MGEISTFMHYSTANYCQSTHDNFKWDCKVYLSPQLEYIEPKNSGLVLNRCGDDYTFGNDRVSNFKPLYHGWDSGTSTVYYAGYNDQQGASIVSFKGTDSIQSAFTKVSPAFGNGVKLHFGFMFAYNKVRWSVQDAIIKLLRDRPNYVVTFTGHSLGGALASIAAIDFLTSSQGSGYRDKVRVITYGAPRVGNSWDIITRAKRLNYLVTVCFLSNPQL
jgi:hypothetical protein